MNRKLQHDLDNFEAVLENTVAEAARFLAGLNERPAGLLPEAVKPVDLPETGVGAGQALAVFKERFGASITGSAGPRYFGFVTGGATPASVMGDWLTSVFDQNAVDFDSSATYVEMEALHFLRQLFGLPPSFSGTFVTGATVSNFVSLAIARQWVARQQGLDVALDGLYAVPPIKILSGAPHASIYKALSMLGLGKNALEPVAVQPEREAVDVEALRQRLVALDGEPCIVV
ncbi:MAG: pyridoxal-dependent decarboxylase, partial [Anaerolineae bacterium]|nr:pyridoxal-dependent decarboxylase [Anaerolineae bacterium]